MLSRPGVIMALAAFAAATSISAQSMRSTRIGDERAVPVHLEDDREFEIGTAALLAHGRRLFEAAWTTEDGGGRPHTKGSGRDLSDRTRPLVGERAFNRLSGPDANACSGCHNAPYGIPGGGGDITTLVFVQGQRFDFLTLDPADRLPTRGTRDEHGEPVTVQSFGNGRATPGLFGAGYIEMLARQMTADLQATRDALTLGESRPLASKGVSFGVLTRRRDGTWDTSRVEGLSRLSLLAPTSLDPPTLIIRPWHQAANVISLREFTSTSFNQHHGIQSTERFGRDTDPDGDGVRNELTRADLTAVALFQAALPVPGRVIPDDPEFERAIWRGETLFDEIGCARCHVTRLPLDRQGWIYSEPGPFNPPTNLRDGEAKSLQIDLNARTLPLPRLAPDATRSSVTWVPAYTDMKLHDITDDDRPMDHEPVDMNHGTWGAGFAKGNRKFLTRRLWGVANEPPYFHHGLYTTLREAVHAHGGEAAPERAQFRALPRADQDALIEFLKSLQVLPPNTPSLVVDQHHRARSWPPRPVSGGTAY